MALEFDENGRVILPKVKREKEEEEKIIWKEEPSIKITRKQISRTTPLKCKLILELSDKVHFPERLESIYSSAKWKFRHMSKLSIKKIGYRKYEITIISGSFRCSWCENFKNYLKKEMNVKIMDIGGCSDFEKG